MDGTYSMRNILNSSRHMEEPQYEMNGMEIAHGTMNNNYVMNGAGPVLTNTYNNNDFVNNKGMVDMYPPEIMSQFKLEQALNNYNYTNQMSNRMYADLNESMQMPGMKTNLDTTGFETHNQLMNYNNTHNTIQGNSMPIHQADEYNNNGDVMYINPNVGEQYSTNFVNNNFQASDIDPTIYSENFKIPNGKYKPLIQNSSQNLTQTNLPYPMPIFENMNNPQMYMQHMNKNMNNSMPQMSQMPTIPTMPTMPRMQNNISVRQTPAGGNNRRTRPKKLFPCC